VSRGFAHARGIGPYAQKLTRMDLDEEMQYVNKSFVVIVIIFIASSCYSDVLKLLKETQS
jgi:hypothetical protein